MSAVCLIPARGGSKRIPRKNLLPLGGKPLLAYAIDNARDSGCFDEIVVSSDDAEILALAERCGVRADRRPESLSDDMTKFVDVLAEFLSRESRFTHFAGLLPTCPFRTADDVRAAMALSFAHPDAFIVGVTAYDFPPQLALTCDAATSALTMREPETYKTTTRSQSLGTLHHPNGSIYCGRVERYLSLGTYFEPPLVGYAMPPERSFDIDYPYQFEIAEAMMRARLSKP
ncbi:MAG: acylneuraminate cytidylyltransferase family protein [Chthoniobacteraceae bacterium]